MRSINKFDVKGQEIFEGDKVLKSWQWFTWKGKFRTGYQIHTITVRPAHMMANNEMHDDGGGVIFCLGIYYNFWDGVEVRKLTAEEVAEINQPDDCTFFFEDDGTTVRLTDQHLLQMSDEDWKIELYRRKTMDHNFWYQRYKDTHH